MGTIHVRKDNETYHLAGVKLCNRITNTLETASTPNCLDLHEYMDTTECESEFCNCH